MIYRSVDDGESFLPVQAIEHLPSRARWKFFHPPFYAGHIHGFAISAARPGLVVAGVEHGALVYSHDAGQTWHERLVGFDLHRIAIDPKDPHHLLAGAGEGLFVSGDAGDTWAAVPTMQGKYIHAVIFDPHVPDRVFVYADIPGSPLYRSDDNGLTWRTAGVGLPNAQPADTLCLHPTMPDVMLYAGDTERRESRLFQAGGTGCAGGGGLKGCGARPRQRLDREFGGMRRSVKRFHALATAFLAQTTDDDTRWWVSSESGQFRLIRSLRAHSSSRLT